MNSILKFLPFILLIAIFWSCEEHSILSQQETIATNGLMLSKETTVADGDSTVTDYHYNEDKLVQLTRKRWNENGELSSHNTREFYYNDLGLLIAVGYNGHSPKWRITWNDQNQYETIESINDNAVFRTMVFTYQGDSIISCRSFNRNGDPEGGVATIALNDHLNPATISLALLDGTPLDRITYSYLDNELNPQSLLGNVFLDNELFTGYWNRNLSQQIYESYTVDQWKTKNITLYECAYNDENLTSTVSAYVDGVLVSSTSFEYASTSE